MLNQLPAAIPDGGCAGLSVGSHYNEVVITLFEWAAYSIAVGNRFGCQ